MGWDHVWDFGLLDMGLEDIEADGMVGKMWEGLGGLAALVFWSLTFLRFSAG
jgi:hypothetical protein